MPKEIDARNLGCPQPVILTRKALEEMVSGVLCVRVNSEVSKDNIVSYAKSRHYPVEVATENGEYVIRITKGEEQAEPPLQQKPATVPPTRGTVFLITSEGLGRGSDDLGLVLMRNFILTLLESGEVPVAMLFVNSGVKLCCEGSAVLEYLMALSSRGARILSCGTCLNFYGLTDKLGAGEVTTMPTIVEYLTGSYQVVTL